MKKFILPFLFSLLTVTALTQVADLRPNGIKDPIDGTPKTAACGTPWVSGGYPAWTNYWGGFQFNIINLSATDITIHSFEARFQGTSGYRIYTKTGTFIGFETNAGAWTLVGSIAGGLTGLSTTAPTPIPIPVEICIPPGATQAFYLTRTDNTAANRHLYVPGTGTPGTTIYASDANLGITEAHYVSPFFAALYAQSRRPSLDVCYSVGCVVLPVELVNFRGAYKDGVNVVRWTTVTEIDNDYFNVERSIDGENWTTVGTVDGAGNSMTQINYEFTDRIEDSLAYYRLKQFDYNGAFEYSPVISIYKEEPILIMVTNTLGQKVDEYYKGVIIKVYADGSKVRTLR